MGGEAGQGVGSHYVAIGLIPHTFLKPCTCSPCSLRWPWAFGHCPFMSLPFPFSSPPQVTLLEANNLGSLPSLSLTSYVASGTVALSGPEFPPRGNGGTLAFLKGISDVVPRNWPSVYTGHPHTGALMR